MPTSMHGPSNQSSLSSSGFICHLNPGTSVPLYSQTQFYFERPAGPRQRPAYQQVGHVQQDSSVTISDKDISLFFLASGKKSGNPDVAERLLGVNREQGVHLVSLHLAHCSRCLSTETAERPASLANERLLIAAASSSLLPPT